MPFIQNRNNFPKPSSSDNTIIGSGSTGEDFGYSNTWLDSARVGNTGPSTSHGNHEQYTSPHTNLSSAEDPLAGALLGVADVITKLVIAHPCTVLRRQCQVHQFARSLHLTPVTLVPVICNMVSREGILTFWKGSIGSCVIWGLSNVTEIVFSDLFGLPRSVVQHGSSEKYWRHILLKATTFFTLTPFYISSFIETVRSESGLSGEGNNVMDVLVKGVDRMRFAVFGARDASRRFSVLHLAIPTVIFRTSHYIIQMALYQQFFRMARRYVNRKTESERTKFHQYVPQIFAHMSSSVLTDLIFLPVETILHRMYIQGTRTLIDNLDTGLSAVSITIKYNGFFDCLKSLIDREGFWALYSGVGALALEYMLHSLLHQVVRACFDRGSEVLRRAAINQQHITPSIASNAAYSGTRTHPLGTPAPLSGPFAQPLSPVVSPRKQSHMITPPPIRDSTQFPTFGESMAQLDSSFDPPPFLFPSNRTNVFGSPYRENDAPNNSGLPPSLAADRTNDPFSG